MHSIQSAAEVAISAPLPSALRLRIRAAVVRAALCVVIALSCASAHAELPYRVELVGPSDLKEVVEPNLDLPRWRDFPGMTPDLLKRLAVEERDHIRSAVETEGYFSANVSAEVTEGEAGVASANRDRTG